MSKGGGKKKKKKNPWLPKAGAPQRGVFRGGGGGPVGPPPPAFFVWWGGGVVRSPATRGGAPNKLSRREQKAFFKSAPLHCAPAYGVRKKSPHSLPSTYALPHAQRVPQCDVLGYYQPSRLRGTGA